MADEYVVATEGSVSPELPLEPVSLRLRHRHGSYEDQAGEDTWIQLQHEAEMLNLYVTTDRSDLCPAVIIVLA